MQTERWPFTAYDNQCKQPRCTSPPYRRALCKAHYSECLAAEESALREATKKTKGCVYLYAVSANVKPKRVKLGISSDPESRTSNMQTGCPVKLKLMGYVLASYALESAVHEMLSEYRIRGEWFRYEGLVKRFVDAIASGSLDKFEACFD